MDNETGNDWGDYKNGHESRLWLNQGHGTRPVPDLREAVHTHQAVATVLFGSVPRRLA